MSELPAAITGYATMSGLMWAVDQAQDLVCAGQTLSQLSPYLRNFYVTLVDDYTNQMFAGNAS